MVTIAPSSGPSVYAEARSRIGCVGSRSRGLGIDAKAGARALPFRVGDARERILQPITSRAPR
jgi:hypothetical protein